jgi:hypothetical protein
MEMYEITLTQAVLPVQSVVVEFVVWEIVAVTVLSLVFAGLTLWYMLKKV